MKRCGEKRKRNVISIRCSDEEKAAIYAVMQRTQKNITELMRESMFLYCKYLDFYAFRDAKAPAAHSASGSGLAQLQQPAPMTLGRASSLT